jgi:hypothetical protein
MEEQAMKSINKQTNKQLRLWLAIYSAILTGFLAPAQTLLGEGGADSGASWIQPLHQLKSTLQ